VKPHPFWLVPSAAVVAGVLLPRATGAFTPNVQWLNVYGDNMNNYDFEGSVYYPDWPVGMIWGCLGYRDDVQDYLETLPTPYHKLTNANKTLRVWEDTYGGAPQDDDNSGNQTDCFSGYDGNACMSDDRCVTHTRVYAPGGWMGECFKSMWGYYSVASHHYDLNHVDDDCVGTGQERFGWGEIVESRIRNQAKADNHTSASFYNMQTYGYDWVDSTHYHQSDGYA
jgi:hypothetical protein